MSGHSSNMSVIDDNRAVSTVIGVVILFGFLILALSLYQVEIVPQQNAETEFQHSGEVRNDLVELRAGILQAGSIDQPQYQTVQLGTAYSTRTFTVNPPSPAGTIRTTDPYPITISNNSGTPEGTITIPTRFIEYQPGYNELDRSPMWYDASVLYLDAREEGGGIAVIEDQALVDNGKVQITALQNEFRRSGTGQVTLELRPAESVTGEIPEGDLTVTVPTRLSDDEYWGGTDIPNNEYSITDDTNDDGVYNLTLDTTTSNLTVDTVGVQEAPENPTQNDAARVGGSGSGNNDDGDNDDGSTGDPLPAGAVAFNDQNGDGLYNNNEPTYTESEAAQLDDPVDLVIEKDIISNKIDIGTQSVQLKNGARLETTNELKLDVSGNIDLQAGTIDSENKITLKSSNGGIDAQETTLESKNEMEITASGNVDLTGAAVDSNNKITVTASGAFTAQDATLESKNEMKITASGDVDLTGATADSNNKITVTASGAVNAQDTTLGSDNEMKITANGGDIDLSGSTTISNNKITLTSSADIDLRNTAIQAQNIKASPASSGTLFVNDNGGTRADGGTYIEKKNGKASDISLQQGTVDGTPEKGRIK
ncbi:DUF4097 domain-containing protein [Halorubrum sp. SP9]|uniref:DUF4097 domain-containing protein n=1 Tax=Halorubrum sp. SP9 TaxID=1537267 RepID=UPI0010F4947D|nr:DUF4097 domain-containing protein [Halorubrum sp. SP9]TKX68225.1 hypothetical protein EXE45_12155 [Halorubrum sp. SP9]